MVAIRLEDVFHNCTLEEYEKLMEMDIPLGETIGDCHFSEEEKKLGEQYIEKLREESDARQIGPKP